MQEDEVLEVFFSLDAKQTKRGASLQIRLGSHTHQMMQNTEVLQPKK